MYQFLPEAFWISGGWAVMGILIGFWCHGGAFFLPGNLRRAGVAVIWVGVLWFRFRRDVFFGYLPANQAAKLAAIESVRYD